MGYYHWGEDYFSHEFPPAYKGATACRGIDFNDNVGECSVELRAYAKGSLD